MKNFENLAVFLGLFVCIIELDGSIISSGLIDNYRQNRKLLEIGVYYETKCPDSKRFLINQITSAQEKFSSVVDFTLIPFGKANYTRDSINSDWNFMCQHGPDECYGNIIHNCLIQERPNFVDHFPFISCTMENIMINFEAQALECAMKHSVDYEKLKQCAKSTIGNNLLYQAGEKTHSLDPKLNYVPWITVNNLHTNEIQKTAEANLTYFICSELKDTITFSFCPRNGSISIYGCNSFFVMFLITFFKFLVDFY
ncbi:unnamed protein product [Brachionus calyciflorus]|uniref:Gamma-interferon-inducible lysosomal thiol reductase n=1 Tax=Brachionus calyciflorus TaxID=104777 RepID=A0A813NX37_9BILA|nr:unnamed protein product [Brachionus calyciflorus]